MSAGTSRCRSSASASAPSALRLPQAPELPSAPRFRPGVRGCRSRRQGSAGAVGLRRPGERLLARPARRIVVVVAVRPRGDDSLARSGLELRGSWLLPARVSRCLRAWGLGTSCQELPVFTPVWMPFTSPLDSSLRSLVQRNLKGTSVSREFGQVSAVVADMRPARPWRFAGPVGGVCGCAIRATIREVSLIFPP